MARPLTLVRSGWWVAVAGLAVAAGIVWLAARGPSPRANRSPGDGHDPSTYGFNLSPSLVPAESIVAAGIPRDGLPTLERPQFISAVEVERRNNEGRGKFLLASDRVIGVAVAGEARAYPIRLMRWHELINDRVGGRPLLVTYSPLCDAAVVAEPVVEGETLEIGVSGLMWNSNPLLYDRRADPARSSLWSQLDGRAVAGSAAASGRSLPLRPAALTTWGRWSDRYPDTRVLEPMDRLKRVYKRDPYHSYFGSDVLRFPVEPLPTSGGLRLKDRVLILTLDGTDTVYSLARIAKTAGEAQGSWSTTVGTIPVTIHFDAVVGAALVDWPAGLEDRVASRQAFWFAWFAQHPDTPRPLPPG